jgi:hypothetical protein
MLLIGTAGVDGMVLPRAEPPVMDATAISSRVPHVAHSGHRPNHFAVMWRHSEQRY